MAVEKYNAPYIDSSVFIAWLNREVVGGVDRYAIADHIIQAAEAGEYRMFISALTLAEVRVSKLFARAVMGHAGRAIELHGGLEHLP